jgi:hypothetical protein
MDDRLHLNSFQEWARGYCEARGFTILPQGNWVIIQGHGLTMECMTEQGVKKACDEIAAA